MAENSYENEYQENKKVVLSCLREITAISQDLEEKNRAKSIEDDMIQLDNEAFHLVVVGEFSRGKSTFINAMLGANVLPMNITPTTAILSKIVYGRRPSFTLQFQDGHSESMDAEAFQNLRASANVPEESEEEIKQNIETEKWISSIDHATVTYPLDFCKNHVEIIDTPGVNDISKSRVDITCNYLKHADAAILVLAANQAVTSSEVQFLKEQIIDNQIHHLFIAANYKDLVPANRWNNVISYIKEHIGERMPDKKIPPVFLVSSKQALIWRRHERGEEISRKLLRKYLKDSLTETGFPEFEQSLRTFLFKDKGKAKIEKYVKRSFVHIAQLENRLRVQIQDLGRSTADIEEKARRMKPVFEETERQATRIRRDLEVALKNHEAELMLQCNTGLENMQAAAEKSVDSYTVSMSRKKLMELIQDAVNPIQKQFYQEIELFQKKQIQQEVDRAVEKANRVWNNVEICYSNSQALIVADNALATIGDIEIDKEAIYKTDDTIDGFAAGAALGGLAAIVIAHPIALLGGVIFGFDTIFNATRSFIASLLGGFSDSPNEKARQQIKKQLRANFAEKNDAIRHNIAQSYRKQSEQMVAMIDASLKGKVEDLQNQLQSTLREKKNKEEVVAEKVAFLKTIDAMLQRDKQRLKEVIM